MSPEIQGVLQPPEDVTFWRVLAFYISPQLCQQGMLIHNQGIFLDVKVADLV